MANYWTSTQHLYWEDPTYEALATVHTGGDDGEDTERLAVRFPLPEPRLLNLFLQQRKRYNIRQTVIATATVYIRRYYLKVDIRKTNPFLVITTAFYLACKVEECQQHIKIVLGEARTLWIDLIQPDTAKVGECEFELISEMHSQLIIHHPYRNLDELQARVQLSGEERSVAWSIINDHYVTDLLFRYPPHMIAATAVIMALTIGPAGRGTPVQDRSQQPNQPRAAKIDRVKEWLREHDIDIETLVICTQQMISLYAVMERYSERTCRDQLVRCVKEQGLDK